MKNIEENLNELLEVFDGTGVPNKTWVKDKLEETLIVAKNCSIHNVIVSFDKGYDLGYKDATSEACKEIEKNYRPNER